MGNSSSKYDPMLSNMPPGYIPTWPAVPPWKIKKKRWNPFRSKKNRDAEMRQWYYTTPFVYQYPPGSSYPFPNPVGQGTTYPSQSAAAMPVPNPALPPALVYERSSRRRRRRSRSPDSGSDSASYDEEGRYRRPYRSGSYGGSRHNPLPAPPKDVLASTPYRYIFRQLPSIRSGSQSRYDYPYDYNRDRDRDRDRDREYRRRHRDRDRDRGRGRDVDLEYARDRDRDYRDQDVERRRAEDRYERDRERREREQARAERERERQEREMANAERAAEHAQRGYDQQDREMEEREREREIRAAVEPGFRPLRRQHGLSFTEQVAGGLAGIFGRGPRMPEPEPTGEGIPRSPVPHGGGYGGIPVSPMGFPPVIPSSTAGPPPAPPAFITPVGGAGVGMPQPGVPGIVPGVVPPTAGMGMPTPEVPGRMMATPAPPGGMSMPMPGVPGSGMPMPTPSMAGGTTPVIPGHNIAVPGGFMSSPSRPSSGMPYPIPVPLAGGSGGPPSSAFTSGPRVSISGYEYPELMAQSRDQVLYDDDLYPTALHLFEAFKFLPHRPDVAEMIRQSSNHEISEVSERHQQAVRPDWDQVALQMMDEALYYKFRQHTNARDILLATGTAPLLFQDAGDSFWGGGPDDLGDNQMGHSLERVRQRLRDDMAR